MLAFRDHLTGHRTIEAAYLDIIRRGIKVPHLFINQLVHVILRNALDDCGDPYVLRAAELLFRPQRMTLHEGSLIAADEETIAGKSDTPVSPLVSMLGIPAEAEIDVMSDDNAEHYFEHSDQFHVALDLTGGRRGLQALGTVIERWAGHLLAVEAAVEPLTEMREAKLSWYVGLDADGTRIGDALWNGEVLDDNARSRVVGLYRLRFRDPEIVTDAMKGEAAYLILAMTPDKTIRMKPQNLVTGLPVRHLERVT
jgi:predicted DNA-binding transcriptional regulator